MPGLITVALIFVIVFGVNTLFWSSVGVTRYLASRFRQAKGAHSKHRFGPNDVAVLIPAHNEGRVIGDSLRAASALVHPSQIHVLSDGSTDDTAEIARAFGANVLELTPNRGKAGALQEGIRHFDLPSRYGVVLLLDADTRLSPDYLQTGLPEFDDPGVVAVAGSVKCLLDPPPRHFMGRLLIAYRSRVYSAVQLLTKYGQAARWANVVTIVPGFASMYRADVLDKIDIAAPGLVIEDFNMTFEVHAKNLGRIVYLPLAAIAYTQDPDNVDDYLSQIRRWSMGFWQTVRLHRLKPGAFWVALSLYVAELIVSSIVQLIMVPLLAFGAITFALGIDLGQDHVLSVLGGIEPKHVVIGFLLPDIFLTVFAAVTLRRPGLLLFAPVFPVMRFVEAYVCLESLPKAWRTYSTGRWVSPERRDLSAPASEASEMANA